MGLCNGTWLICRRSDRNLIHSEVEIGDHTGEQVIIPWIPLTLSPEESGFPFKLLWKQFPIQLAFALSINKSQGQTIGTVGIHLQEPVFSHGQLYVALSRSRSSQSTKIMVTHSKNTPLFLKLKIYSLEKSFLLLKNCSLSAFLRSSLDQIWFCSILVLLFL